MFIHLFTQTNKKVSADCLLCASHDGIEMLAGKVPLPSLSSDKEAERRGDLPGDTDAQEGRPFWPKVRPVQGLEADGKGRVAGAKGKTDGVKSRAATADFRKDGPEAARRRWALH